MQTTHFSHCWAVFEGGGVRGSAHAGAFAAAREAGITFGRVAGTSAGSIVAALIAAGAPPAYISKTLEQTDFSKFLLPATREQSAFNLPPKWFRVVRNLLPDDWKKWSSVAIDTGLYNSKSIQDWMEQHLRAILGPARKLGEKKFVTFDELPLPLHVIATDLTTGQPKVWSREATPTESVAFAVRCSCSIPFFYQAVEYDQSLLVDGGVVSNLPTYVYSQLMNSSEGRTVLSRILAFRLVSDSDVQKPNNIFSFALQLADSVISSATNIQQSLQPFAYDLPIYTGKIKSTDLDKITAVDKLFLHEEGKKAVRKFVEKEALTSRPMTSLKIYKGYDEKLLLVVQALMTCDRNFWMAGVSTYWLEFIFPMMLSIARKGVAMICITTATKDTSEMRRRSLLAKLGCNLVELADENELPFDGFLFDIDDGSASAVLSNKGGIVHTNIDYEEESVRLYTSDSDPVVIDILSRQVAKFQSPALKMSNNFPYEECTKKEIFSLLKTVKQYRNATFNLCNLDISDDILVLQRTVKEYKFLQIRQHISDLQSHHCDLFDLRKVAFPDGTHSIVTPPVIENHNGQLILIEGNTRLFHCLARGIDKVTAIIVHNAHPTLPASSPQKLNSLRITSSTTTLEANYSNVNKSEFRRIEEAVHPYP
jgi:predicted acylesterase/phospholipase RssA